MTPRKNRVLDYLLFLRNETTGDVGMYEVDTDAFTPEEYQWYIIDAGENSTDYANSSLWSGKEPRPLYYLKNKSDGRSRALALKSTVAHKSTRALKMLQNR